MSLIGSLASYATEKFDSVYEIAVDVIGGVTIQMGESGIPIVHLVWHGRAKVSLLQWLLNTQQPALRHPQRARHCRHLFDIQFSVDKSTFAAFSCFNKNILLCYVWSLNMKYTVRLRDDYTV